MLKTSLSTGNESWTSKLFPITGIPAYHNFRPWIDIESESRLLKDAEVKENLQDFLRPDTLSVLTP